jgi:hypothetical protein
MAWIYLAESEDSVWPCHPGSDQSPTVRTTDMLKLFYCHGCGAVNFLPPQYGTTSPRSYLSCCPDRKLISSTADSRARTSVLRELERAWREADRVIFRGHPLGCAIRPNFVFLENVPAITVRGLQRVLLEFSALGYDCRWTIVSAGEMGACHLRERWWLGAYAHGSGLQIPGRLEVEKSQSRTQTRHPTIGLVQGDLWGEPISLFRRGDDGLPLKTHRLRALGNSVVPVAAREAFTRLMGL